MNNASSELQLENNSVSLRSEGPRLASIGISEQNPYPEIIRNVEKFVSDAIAKGYRGNILLLLICGKPIQAYVDSDGQTGYIARKCACGTITIPLKYKCSLRICPKCSGIRREKIFRQYYPLFQNLIKQFPSKKYNVNFLTINPPNFDKLEEGCKQIRKDFKKFLRQRYGKTKDGKIIYVKDKIKGGVYVIEARKSKKDNKWNVHIHLCYFGEWLDNVIRGKCNVCKQTRLKYQKNEERYKCANSKCGSSNIIVKNNGLSKIRNIWKKVTGNDCHMDINRKSSTRHTLNYVLKYCGANKENFQSQEDLVEYLCAMQRIRTINKVGEFYNSKIKPLQKEDYICNVCNEKITYELNLDYKYLDALRNSKIIIYEDILKEPLKPKRRIPSFLKKSLTDMRIKEKKLSKELKTYA